MIVENLTITPQIAEVLNGVEQLTSTERLWVARYLLDSVLTKAVDDEANGENLGLTAFEQEQDNEAAHRITHLRPFGLCAGEFVVPDDFDAPLPDEILKTFEGE